MKPLLSNQRGRNEACNEHKPQTQKSKTITIHNYDYFKMESTMSIGLKQMCFFTSPRLLPTTKVKSFPHSTAKS